ncbi:MAG TPA: DUF998 domain-containing protein [Chthoniobacterales bacterium]|jgi:hypothetical protein
MKRARSQILGNIVVLATLYWVAVIVLMHVLEAEFSPVRVPMSAYVAGAHGGWMTTSFFALATALLATAFGVIRTSFGNVPAWVGCLLFIVAAVGVVLAGIFPGIIRRPSSIHWHVVGSLFAFPGMAFGSLLLSFGFSSDRDWQRISVATLTLSGGVVLLLALSFSSVTADFAGLVQRLFFALLIPWLVLVGVHLMRFEDADSPAAERN